MRFPFFRFPVFSHGSFPRIEFRGPSGIFIEGKINESSFERRTPTIDKIVGKVNLKTEITEIFVVVGEGKLNAVNI